MAFWGAPRPTEQHAFLACKAALEIKKSVSELVSENKKSGKAVMFTRMGIKTGELIIGNMGAPERLNYSCLGDTVNVAARLESINKVYNTEILIGETTNGYVKGRVVSRIVDRVAVKGKTQGTVIYEPLAIKTDADDSIQRLADISSKAFTHYQEQNWDSAIELLDEILSEYPDVGPASIIRERCIIFKDSPPPENWNGIYVAKSK